MTESGKLTPTLRIPARMWLRARDHSFTTFLRKTPTLVIGLILVLLWAMIALFAPYMAPYSPVEPHATDVLSPPSPSYWFGTDINGMDILSRILYAPRIDLGIAVTSTLISFILGTPLGALAGYFAGRGGVAGVLAQWSMRVVDISLAFPVFIFALILVALLGASSFNIVVAQVFVNAPVFVWLTRGEVLSVRGRKFVEAARCSGNSELRIALRHVLPNSVASSLTQFSVTLGYSVLLTASLSFVGAGVRVPTPEWGLMVSQGVGNMITGQWWPSFFPGLALATAVLGFSFVGDGLRRYLDPRKRR